MNDTSQQPSKKRRTKRVTPAPDQPVRVDLKCQDFIEAISTVNISEGGVGISAPHGLEGCNLDEVIVTLVKLPEPVNHSFSVTARVIHHHGNNFGVQFKNLNKDDEESLSRYIEHRLVNIDSVSLMKMLYGG